MMIATISGILSPTMSGDYSPENLRWALQAPGRVSNDSTFEA